MLPPISCPSQPFTARACWLTEPRFFSAGVPAWPCCITCVTRLQMSKDWANAAAGDPRADYARTYTILHFADIGDPELLKVFARGWQDGYMEAAPPLEGLDFFFAWAGAYMVRDLTHKIDQLAPVFTRERLADVARWADGCQDRGRSSSA